MMDGSERSTAAAAANLDPLQAAREAARAFFAAGDFFVPEDLEAGVLACKAAADLLALMRPAVRSLLAAAPARHEEPGELDLALVEDELATFFSHLGSLVDHILKLAAALLGLEHHGSPPPAAGQADLDLPQRVAHVLARGMDLLAASGAEPLTVDEPASGADGAEEVPASRAAAALAEQAWTVLAQVLGLAPDRRPPAAPPLDAARGALAATGRRVSTGAQGGEVAASFAERVAFLVLALLHHGLRGAGAARR